MLNNYLLLILDKEITVQLTKGVDSSAAIVGRAAEVRGIVKDATTIVVSGPEVKTYDSEFDM